jgi:hypothetical protein
MDADAHQAAGPLRRTAPEMADVRGAPDRPSGHLTDRRERQDAVALEVGATLRDRFRTSRSSPSAALTSSPPRSPRRSAWAAALARDIDTGRVHRRPATPVDLDNLEQLRGAERGSPTCSGDAPVSTSWPRAGRRCTSAESASTRSAPRGARGRGRHPRRSAVPKTASIALFVDRARPSTPHSRSPMRTRARSPGSAGASRPATRVELAAARSGSSLPTRYCAASTSVSDLTSGAADTPARQRTLRETIAWSHDLLQPAERILSPESASSSAASTCPPRGRRDGRNDARRPTSSRPSVACRAERRFASARPLTESDSSCWRRSRVRPQAACTERAEDADGARDLLRGTRRDSGIGARRVRTAPCRVSGGARMRPIGSIASGATSTASGAFSGHAYEQGDPARALPWRSPYSGLRRSSGGGLLVHMRRNAPTRSNRHGRPISSSSWPITTSGTATAPSSVDAMPDGDPGVARG